VTALQGCSPRSAESVRDQGAESRDHAFVLPWAISAAQPMSCTSHRRTAIFHSWSLPMLAANLYDYRVMLPVLQRHIVRGQAHGPFGHPKFP
jgi:hypothetical protein